MRKPILLISVGLLAILTALGGIFVYDATRADRIATGVTVNGIDVGDMQAGAARVKLRRMVIEPLERPMKVRHSERQFELTARQARLAVDVEGSVQRALEVSRAGDPLSRTWRQVTGAEVNNDVTARVTYSRASVKRLVDRVGRELDRDAVEADVEIDADGIAVRRAREGRRIDARRLERQLHRRLVDFDGRRSVDVRTATVEPEVTDDDLEKRYPAVLIVDRKAFTLTLYENLKQSKRYQVAVGKVGMDTPRGLYQIQNKAINPDWYVPDSDWAGDLAGKVIKGDDPKNPIKARWLGIYDGVGIHGTSENDSIGSAASHGCIRMRIPEVKALYEDVPVNAPVYIS
ncbi:MAG: L,D-transpeptidase/peptidoglycan binding protein [Solirubrobacterales bacterium]|nr:L,D-transpeptidase/peptidoglycan binding protein [Solirubrobacterales bacterium]